MSAQDGGPAFPVVAENGLEHISAGMSIRDAFAMHAPIDMALAISVWQGANRQAWPGWDNEAERGAVLLILADLRMEYADAMLAARAQEAI